MSKFINSISTTNWLLIGLIVVAVAGVGYYFWHKKQVEDADAIVVDGPAVETAE